MRIQAIILSGAVALTLTGCDGTGTSREGSYLACTVTADCVARGGTCVAGACRAENECTTDADCAAGQACVADPDFGGLCAAPGAPTQPLPAWACQLGQECPLGQGCASDGFCHVDGECHTMIDPQGNTVSDCPGGLLCFTAGPIVGPGICSDDRALGPNPNCRSDGEGACRTHCAVDTDCGIYATCDGGYCHLDDECVVDADCSLNHVCVDQVEFDSGYDLCEADEDPTCVDDPEGVCRLRCAADRDCINGGGCAADGFCHASNECHTGADCPAGQLCYPVPQWGGLCGPPRPM